MTRRFKAYYQSAIIAWEVFAQEVGGSFCNTLRHIITHNTRLDSIAKYDTNKLINNSNHSLFPASKLFILPSVILLKHIIPHNYDL